MADPSPRAPSTESLAALCAPVWERDPARVALVAGGRAVRYGEVGDAVRRAVVALDREGVGPGDVVGLVDECGVDFVATVLGAAHLGAAAAPMSHRLTAAEIRELGERAACTRVVAGERFRELVAGALGRPPVDLRAGGRAGAAGGGGRGAPVPAPARLDAADTALVIFSSGTTGLPKPVPLAQGDVAARVGAYAPPFDPERPPGISIMSVPAVHVGGLVGLLVALASGSTTVVQRRFDAGEWLRLVEEHRVERAFLVPAMLRRILDHPFFPDADLSSLELVSYGAAPAARELILRAVEALPHAGFSNVFGQTETIGAVTALTPEDHRRPEKIGSVGRPLPGLRWRIVEPGSDADVPEGAVGELVVRQRGGWRRTGDLVRADVEGYLWPEGRLADTINRGGEKLGPVEVEAVLGEHPAVREVAVAGYPDEELGERVGAAVVLAADVGVGELVAWCRERLAPWKVPDRVAVVEALPLSELGKVRRADVARLILDVSGTSRPRS